MFDATRKIFTYMMLFIVFLSGNLCFGAEEEKITVVGSKEQAEVDWMENLRENVSDTVFLSAVWFDSFFAEDEFRQYPPKVSARIRLGWEPKSGDLSEFKTRFRLRVRLPHFSNRMDLILSDDDQDDINQLPLEYVENDSVDDSEKFAAAVRFVHKNTDTTISDTRIGISSGDIFLRARYKRSYVVSDRHAFKIQPWVYYYLNDGLGARLLTEYDYQINLRQQLRVNFSVRASESFHGVRWKHGLYHLNQFSLSQAGILGLVVEGKKNEENSYFIDKYALTYRYRFNAYRSWLFFEIEPFIEWPEERDYKTVPGIALRVEGYFNKS